MGLLVVSFPRSKRTAVQPSREERIRQAARDVDIHPDRRFPRAVAWDEDGVVVHPDASPRRVTRAVVAHLRHIGKADAGLDVERLVRPTITRRMRALSV